MHVPRRLMKKKNNASFDLQVPRRQTALTHGVIHQLPATNVYCRVDSSTNIRQLQLLI